MRRPVHRSYLSNTSRHGELSRTFLARMQARIRRTLGISSAQRLKTSDLQAARSVAVWAEPGVGNAMTQTATAKRQPSLLTPAHDVICLVPKSISLLCGGPLWRVVDGVIPMRFTATGRAGSDDVARRGGRARR